MLIELTAAEVLLAATVGLHRHVAAIRRGLPDRHGHDGAGWNLHIEGACGEMAVAKALNVFWTGSINAFKNGGDVGHLQVRTRSRDFYDLPVRPDDKQTDVFVLVTGLAPRFEIRGWILGAEARRDDWQQTYGDRPAAWFVPQSALNPIATLRAKVVSAPSDTPRPPETEILSSIIPVSARCNTGLNGWFTELQNAVTNQTNNTVSQSL